MSMRTSPPVELSTLREVDSPQPLPPRLPVRVMVISDALVERNGVGTYYQDLVEQLQDRVEHISLIAPSDSSSSCSPSPHEWLSIPLPGDRTQRLVFPRRRSLQRLLDEQQPSALIVPTLGP